MSSDSSCSSPLERFVGSWRGEVTVDGVGGEPQRYTQHNSFAWAVRSRALALCSAVVDDLVPRPSLPPAPCLTSRVELSRIKCTNTNRHRPKNELRV
jgi:hypothetical protein